VLHSKMKEVKSLRCHVFFHVVLLCLFSLFDARTRVRVWIVMFSLDVEKVNRKRGQCNHGTLCIIVGMERFDVGGLCCIDRIMCFGKLVLWNTRSTREK
jgi:hypothetical protein